MGKGMYLDKCPLFSSWNYSFMSLTPGVAVQLMSLLKKKKKKPPINSLSNLEKISDFWNQRDCFLIQDLMALQLTVHSLLCSDEWTTHPYTHIGSISAWLPSASFWPRESHKTPAHLSSKALHQHTHFSVHFNLITHVLIMQSWCTLRYHNFCPLPLLSVHAHTSCTIHLLPLFVNNLNWSIILTTITV